VQDVFKPSVPTDRVLYLLAEQVRKGAGVISIQEFFDKVTFTVTYLVWDPTSRDAVAIDPVLDYEPIRSTVTEQSVGAMAAFIQKKELTLHYILETHAHADHLSGAQALRARYSRAKVAIGAGITEVQRRFKPIFGLPHSFPTDGSQFDCLLEDGKKLEAGKLTVGLIATPGHTQACFCFLVGDCVFTGDTLFMPDYGVGRCDFPGGSAEALYDSVMNRLYTLNGATRTFTGHDYLPNGRPFLFESTIGDQKRSNIHLTVETTRTEFTRLRRERDQTLSPPRLLLPSVQVNINAGHLPVPRDDGRRYLSIPIEFSVH
jgi:glyoxylase-like metal-dependent hydrolase (beta-lactamase superfamily II)